MIPFWRKSFLQTSIGLSSFFFLNNQSLSPWNKNILSAYFKNALIITVYSINFLFEYIFSIKQEGLQSDDNKIVFFEHC